MLSVEYCDKHIKLLEHKIRVFKKSELESQKEYVEHLRRLLSAYNKERIKAYSRPVLIIEKDYILDSFPRRGEFV